MARLWKYYISFVILTLSIVSAQLDPLTGIPDITKDPVLNNALSINNWLPGGKHDNPGKYPHRGEVGYQREAYSIIPITNMKLGVFSVQNAVVGAQHYYEDHFGNHPYWQHSPFDEVSKSSSSDKVYHGSGSQTGYDMQWEIVKIHPADGYTGAQGGGYPKPAGGYDTYNVNLTGMAVGTYFVPQWDNVTYDPSLSNRNPLDHWSNAATKANEKLNNVLNDSDRGFWSKTAGVLASFVEGAVSPITGLVGIGSPELGSGSEFAINRASEVIISNVQQMSVAGQFEAIKIGDVLTSCEECKDVLTVGTAVLGLSQTKYLLNKKGIKKGYKHMTPEDQASIKSYQKLIAEHEQKLLDYKKNPDMYDNKGHLANAPNEEVRQNIYNSRILNLEREINKFKNNMRKLELKYE